MPLMVPALIELDAEFVEWITAIYDRRWTGTVLLKFNRGKPQMVGMPSVEVRFDRRELDKSRELAQATK